MLAEVASVSQRRRANLATLFLTWAVPLGISVAFAFLPVVIEAHTDGWVTTALWCESALVEIIGLALRETRTPRAQGGGGVTEFGGLNINL